MKILKKNLREGVVTVTITNNEDLWYLSHIIEEGDQISGSTERRMKPGGDERSKTIRKRVYLKIQIEKVEYAPEMNSLRALGVILEGPSDVPMGDHHSFNVELRDTIKIKKKDWPRFVLQKLEESTKEKTNILMLIFDREEAIFASLKNNNYEVLAILHGNVQKKDSDEEVKSTFYKEIVEKMQELNKRLGPDHIVVASPAFWKEYLLKEMPEELKKISVSATVSSVDESAFPELLRQTELQKILEDERLSRELQALDEVLQAINKDKACYGYADCKTKIETGQAKKMLVSENLLKKFKEEGKYKELDILLQNAEAIRVELIIINGKETLQKLDSLGGMAGILRW